MFAFLGIQCHYGLMVSDPDCNAKLPKMVRRNKPGIFIQCTSYSHVCGSLLGAGIPLQQIFT